MQPFQTFLQSRQEPHLNFFPDMNQLRGHPLELLHKQCHLHQHGQISKDLQLILTQPLCLKGLMTLDYSYMFTFHCAIALVSFRYGVALYLKALQPLNTCFYLAKR